MWRISPESGRPIRRLLFLVLATVALAAAGGADGRQRVSIAKPNVAAGPGPLRLAGTVAAAASSGLTARVHYGDPSEESCEADEEVRGLPIALVFLSVALFFLPRLQ